MKILILGMSGVIGKNIYQCFYKNYNVKGTYFKNIPENISRNDLFFFDAQDFSHISSILKEFSPDVVISCLRGEFEDQLKTHELVAKYLKQTEGRCFFLSTANVFDGDPSKRATESDNPNPISDYGIFKFKCERLLKNALGENLVIIRLPHTYTRCSLLEMVERVAKRQETIFENLYISLNTGENVALAIEFLIKENKKGIYHLASSDIVGQKEFIDLVLHELGRKDVDYLVEHLTQSTYLQALGKDEDSSVESLPEDNFIVSVATEKEDLLDKPNPSWRTMVFTLLK
ncbi:sugar nucleotide-binding protein [Tissierella praeacuta]|uniref:sugar nucleotide-binding protein n=1 Tax=Tissierella praeacuta TaxID=43131 RepID=UPI003342B0F8